MADLPPAESIDEEMQRAREALKAARRAQPGETQAQARSRAVQAIAIQKRLKAASRRAVTDAVKVVHKTSKTNGAGSSRNDVLVQLAQGFVPLTEIVVQLLERVVKLEARPNLTDGGTWNAEKVFRPGEVVTHDGSAWVCKESSLNARPGQHDAWRLMVKHGKDARGSR